MIVLAVLLVGLFPAPAASAQTTDPPPPPEEEEEEEDTASRRTAHAGTFWLGYMSTWFVAERWSVWFDTHYNERAFYVLRGGLSHHFDAGPTVTAGYAHLWTDPGNGTLSRNEHRPWAQVVFPVRYTDRWAFSERVRWDVRVRESIAEGRVSDGFDVTNRLRLQTVLTHWFPERSFGRFLLQVANESLVNFGPDVGPNRLDQNRVSVLFGIRSGGMTFRVGYMDRFLPGTSGRAPTHEHAALFWVTHVVRLGNTDETPPPPESGNP